MLKIYNSLSRKKEKFKPLQKNKVKMYTCGPTVYDYTHIGNFRSYIISDVIRRYLEFKNYKVKKIHGITDVGHFTEDDAFLGEDKMLKASKKEKKTPQQIAKFYTKSFFQDEKKLNIKKSDNYPRATEHIKEMQKMIKILVKEGYTYKLNDGIYFHVPKFKNYGKLSGNTLKNLKKGVRIEPNPDKKHPADFALWKKAKPEHLMQWDSPWGKGFPGWHIECSVMSKTHLGKKIDIHTGGEDNKFPHHENEIVQSESANKTKFVSYWIHIKHLLINGETMSKSKGNFFKLNDLEEKGFSPISYRLFVLNSHYRNKFNFTLQGLRQAETNIRRVEEFIERLKELSQKNITKKDLSNKKSFDGGRDAISLILKASEEFEKAMNNDFNTPLALAAVFHLINRGNWLLDKEKLTSSDAKEIIKNLKKMDKVLGFIFIEKQKKLIPKNILELAEKREEYRKNKEWKKADDLREKISQMGYNIKDVKKGFLIKKNKK